MIKKIFDIYNKELNLEYVNAAFKDPEYNFCSLNSVEIEDVPVWRKSLPEGKE